MIVVPDRRRASSRIGCARSCRPATGCRSRPPCANAGRLADETGHRRRAASGDCAVGVARRWRWRVLAACSDRTFGQPRAGVRAGRAHARRCGGCSSSPDAPSAASCSGLILYVIIRFRRRSDEIPSQKSSNVGWEAVYTITPIVLVAVLFGTVGLDTVQDRQEGRRSRPHRQRDRLPVGMAVRVPGAGCDGHRIRVGGRAADAGAARGSDGAPRAAHRRCHPLVLGAGVPDQARPDPRRRQQHRRHAEPRSARSTGTAPSSACSITGG